MQFKGTFRISAFDQIAQKSEKLLKEFREVTKAGFYSAIAASIFEYAQYVPVLTGDTRKELQAILADLDTRSAKIKRNDLSFITNWAGKLEVSALTESLIDTRGDRPVKEIGNKEYAGKYPWPKDFPLVWVADRLAWRKAVMEYGADGTNEHEVQYNWGTNQWYGKYTFYFSTTFPNVSATFNGKMLEEVFEQSIEENFDIFLRSFDTLVNARLIADFLIPTNTISPIATTGVPNSSSRVPHIF